MCTWDASGPREPMRSVPWTISPRICLAWASIPREMAERRGGDRLGQHYGMPGDFRLQTHGYEYRTFPSWLDSPALAFISITLAKLCVHCPGLVTRSG